MSNFSEWWEGLSFSLKIYWGLAIPFTFFFLLQLILTFFGGGDVHDDVPDAEVESDTGIPFQFFTMKNLVAFFAIFGWTGVACVDSGLSEWLSLVIAIIAGLATMMIMAYLLYMLSKANVSGTMSFKKAIGQSGEVYIPIPSTRKGTGKVSVKVQGSLRTLDAITDDAADLPTGKIITVTGIVSDSILLVTAG
jgi:hypothetical protein